MKIIVDKRFYEAVSETYADIEFFSTPEQCPEADVLISDVGNITVEKLTRLPKLRWIQSLRAGFDSIDMDYIKKRNIIFTNGKDLYSIPIAENVVGSILMHNTKALKYINNKNNKVWEPLLTNRFELKGQTVGILGTGSIAVEIAKRLQGFQVNIIGYKRTPVITLPYFDEIYSGKKGLEYVLSKSDYVVIAVDLNKDTYHMINKEKIMLMKKTAALINVARGSIVNQKDLTDALKNKDIDFAALDVFETEPLDKNDEIWGLDNVYITPHCSGIVKNNKDRLKKLIIDNIGRFKENETLLNIVK